jgi:vacuolar protein sorting-associated protein 13A/C
MGKIGKLKINVPWSRLSSEPVEVIIESVNVVIIPKGKDEWKAIEKTINTCFDMKEAMVDRITQQIYSDLIKAKEVVESEQGMFKRIMTRCVDNLQVCIQNLHIRFESNNP